MKDLVLQELKVSCKWAFAWLCPHILPLLALYQYTPYGAATGRKSLSFQLCHSSDHKCLPCVKWHDIAQNGYIATINLAHLLNEWYKSYFGVLNWWDVCSWVTNAQGAPARAVQNLCLELKSALQQHCLKVLGPTYGDIFAHLAITPLRKNENKNLQET
jgi:hypothetical protein